MSSRRSFLLRSAKALAGGITLLFANRALAKKVGLRLSQLPDIRKVGGQTTVKIKGKMLLIFRTGPDRVTVTDANCTHQACFLSYDPKAKRINCGCHGSYFFLNGRVGRGPATKKLMVYPAVLHGDQLVITLSP